MHSLEIAAHKYGFRYRFKMATDETRVHYPKFRSIPRSPYFLPLKIFTASKGPKLYFIIEDSCYNSNPMNQRRSAEPLRYLHSFILVPSETLSKIVTTCLLRFINRLLCACVRACVRAWYILYDYFTWYTVILHSEVVV